jgi:phosphopantetheinyl transferase (holo-ACP synthase)
VSAETQGTVLPRASAPMRLSARMPGLDVSVLSPARPVSAVPAAPAGGALAAGAWEQALHAYFETMELFLAVQQAFAAEFIVPAGGSPGGLALPAQDSGARASPPGEPPAPAADWPLLGETVEHVRGERLVVRRRFDLRGDLFLDAHRLSAPRTAFTDPDLGGLPVMPLTVTLELMAEAACALAPGRVVTELGDVTAARWITFEDDARTLRVRAEMLPASDADPAGPSAEGGGGLRIRVAVTDDDTQDAFRPPLAEAVVVLAAAYPPAPAAPESALRDAGPRDWRGEAIYPDRLFHGPRLRAITAVTRWAPNGSDGTLTVPPRAGLFRETTAPRFATDPVLLDALGATVGTWSANETFRGIVPFPFRVERIRLFAPPPPEGATVAFRHRVTRRDAETASNTLVMTGGDGACLAWIEGWQDRFFTVTPAIHRTVHRTRDRFFTEPLALPAGFAEPAPAARVTPALPDGLFASGFRIWEAALAYCVLDRAERAEWRHNGRAKKRAEEWLLGRAAAKDAVRACLADRFGVCVAPADVGVQPDALGKPHACGAWADWIAGGITLSMAHSGGRAAAVAAPAGEGALGLDMEAPRALSDHFYNGAFSEDEQARIGAEAEGPGRDGNLLRLWCAKEALGKALGTGLLGNPRGLCVMDWNHAAGRVDVALTGAWLERFPEHAGRRFRVRTWLADGMAFGLCRLVRRAMRAGRRS